MDLAAFHLQSARYNSKRPPAFGEHPELSDLNRYREREYETTLQELEEQINNTMEPTGQSLRSRFRRRFLRRRRRGGRQQGGQNNNNQGGDATAATTNNNNPQPIMAMPKPKKKRYKSISRTTPAPTTTTATFTSVFASVFGIVAPNRTPLTARRNAPSASSVNLVVRTDSARHFDQAWEHGQPPLFLQEGAHLLSLLSAVGACRLFFCLALACFGGRCFCGSFVDSEKIVRYCYFSPWNALFLCLLNKLHDVLIAATNMNPFRVTHY